MLRCLVLAIVPLAAGCGAGVIGGVLAGNRRSSAPDVRTATVDRPWMAYFGLDGEVRFVTLTGYEAPSGANLRVFVRIPGVVDRRGGTEVPYLDWDQTNAQILDVRSKVTRLAFTVNATNLATTLIELGVDPTQADLTAELRVLVDGVAPASPIPLTLYRLMRASLEFSQPGATEEVVSVAGGDFVCRVRGYPPEAERFEIDLLTFDPREPGTFLQQRITNVRVETVEGSDELRLFATAPPNLFPCRLYASVRHTQAGQSTPIEQLYYGPDVGFVAPGTLSTDGGTRVLVIGGGLVPLSFPSAGGAAVPDYDKLELWIEKGGRRTRVPPNVVQRQSPSLSRLAFEVPASPDGRPGLATLVLRSDLHENGQGAVVETAAVDLVAYGDTSPVFGPRGTSLPTRPQHVAFGQIENAEGAVDAVMCSGSLPNVHLFVSADNGMLRRFGAPWIAGASAELSQRRPQRLLIADVDGDHTNDVFVLNGGDDLTASHTLLAGRPAPDPPLLSRGAIVTSGAAVATMAYGDIDHNGMVDVVVLPPVHSKLPPEVYLSFGSAGTPRMVVNPITEVVDGYDALELADLDGDGNLDIALARGGIDPVFLSLYGRGDGTFEPGTSLLLENIAGYTPNEDSRAVGLHAIGDARLRGLALVLAGRIVQATRATIAVLDYVGSRQHEAPQPVRVLAYDPERAFVRSLATDLDGDGVRELVVASHSTTEGDALHVLAWRQVFGEPAFVELVGAADLGAEPVPAIYALGAGRAVVPPGAADGQAVFVAHSSYLSGEDRISTLLIDRSQPDVRLLPPDGTRELPYPVDGLALGRFRGPASSVRALDVVAASSGSNGGALRGLQFFDNDGVGVLRPGLRVDSTGLAGSVVTLPRAEGDAVVFLDQTRNLNVVQPLSSNPQRVLSLSLEPYLPLPQRQFLLHADSKLAVGDVDGDGIDDVVALLLFEGRQPTEPYGQMMVVFGRAAPSDELPFVVPDPASVVSVSAHGSARDLVLGDFARESGAPRRLEVAVAVGGSVNHVRFYAVDTQIGPPEKRGLRRSFVSAAEAFLIAGDGPARLAVADVDGDGAGDLVVASVVDRQLRAFASTAGASGDVDVAAFRQLPIGLVTLPDGDLRHLFVRDFNGDNVADIMVTAWLDPTTSVRYYLSTSTGQFANAVLVPPIRTGGQYWVALERQLLLRRAPLAMVVGELNGDDAVDLVTGWASFGPGERNLYELFGGVR